MQSSSDRLSPDRANLIQWATDIIMLWGTPCDRNIEEVARRADNASIQFTQLIQQKIPIYFIC